MARSSGIGETAKRLIRGGGSNQEVLDEVLRLHQGAKTTLKSIRWYRSRMTQDFEDIPSSREAPGLKLAISTPVKPVLNARSSSREVIRASIRGWTTNRQALDAARAAFPTTELNPDDVRGIRAELRRQGEKVPTDAEARRRLAGEPWAADLTKR